jgi:hypothetical protein
MSRPPPDLLVLLPVGDLLAEPLSEAAARLADEGVASARVLVRTLRGLGHRHGNAVLFAAAKSALTGRPRQRRRIWSVSDSDLRDALTMVSLGARTLASSPDRNDPRTSAIQRSCRDIVRHLDAQHEGPTT